MPGVKTRPDYEINPETGCWEWLKCKTAAGYPSGRTHRAYWEQANGAIPPDHHVHHLCRNTSCVNPEHLECVSDREHFAEHYLHDKGLTAEDIRAIVELGQRHGVRAEDVGAQYGIHKDTVYRYWRSATFADITGGGRALPQDRPECARNGCTNRIPPERRRHARYCSVECRVNRDSVATKEKQHGDD